jgi:two-component SAPR family response regulator
MTELSHKLDALITFQENAPIRIQTLGQFIVWRKNEKIDAKEWGRDKSIQLLQYLISNRQRNALHKEKIMDDLWEDGDDRDFKVALHGMNKALEPNRASRTEPAYILRQGVSYHLDLDKIWIDSEALEKYIIIGNASLSANTKIAKKAFNLAIEIYQGIYLPNRIYEDWSSEEREKVHLLILSAYITLAELLLEENPIESIRLSQKAISIDPTWEDAYRLQMQAYVAKGNRPQAIKTYQNCVMVLEKEFGIDPLPETKKIIREIEEIN